MTDKVERVVAALRVVCSEYECDECPSYAWCHSNGQCLDWDAADLIESLAAELVQVKRERDAAVEDIYSMKACALCKHYPSGEECETYFLLCNECDNENCICKECVDGKKMEWRGVQEVDNEQS